MSGRVQSVDATRFAMVPRNDVPRSAFDVRHGHKTTLDAGVLVPILIQEVLPGDSIRLKMTAFCRLSTPIVPMMDNLEFESFFFFVPNRLVWDHWERFMGEQLTPTDSTTFLVPQVVFAAGNPILEATQADYFGITKNNSANDISVSALPFRAYSLIFNDWFRDQDLQNPFVIPMGDGPDDPLVSFALARRNKRHDYFTSARPWPQKSVNQDAFPGMDPLAAGGNFIATRGQAAAPVYGLGVGAASVAAGGIATKYTGGRSGTPTNPQFNTGNHLFLMDSFAAFDGPDVKVLVNDIRTAVLVQQMMERNARGGSRYSELVRSHFGVTSPDARLQRPELLGGGRTMIQVNPVAQTSASGAAGTTTKLGELAAIGSGMVTGHGFSSSFTEHGMIIGIVNVHPYLTYQQGIERYWSRRSQFDFYWPGLAGLGEQAIKSREIFADGSAADDNVFGYQERWSEYKYKPSRTSGFFRSTSATPLDMWHLGEKFASRPVLNNVFVESNPPTSRVLQVATNYGQDFLLDSLFDMRMVRPMPMYSIPGMGVKL